MSEFQVGETVEWESRTGVVDAEYRGRSLGMDGWEATVICRPDGAPPYQTTAPLAQIRKKRPKTAAKFVQVGQVWVSPSTGNRWEVVALVLGHREGEGKVRVRRLPRAGERRIPKWDDGVYVWHATQKVTGLVMPLSG